MFTEDRIIFEDNHLLVINKSPSEIVQGDKTGDAPLSDILKDFLKKKYDKPFEAYLGVAHRLDRPVSGIVVFAKTSKALSRLNEIFRDRKVEKKYWAVVKNAPPKDSDTLIHYLIKNEKLNKSRIVDAQTKNALRCELSYKVIARSTNYYLLEINPLTGRHHQIRVQLSAIGCPIKGDLKYGFSRSNENGSIHLHARQLSFMHPVKKEEIVFKAEPPSDAVWNALKNNLTGI